WSFTKTAQERESFRPVAEAAGTVDVSRFTNHDELTAPRGRECLRARDRDVQVVGARYYNTSKWEPPQRHWCEAGRPGWKARNLWIARRNEKRSANTLRGMMDGPMRDQRAPGAVRHKHGVGSGQHERLIESRYPIAAARCFPVVLDDAAEAPVPGFPSALPMVGVRVAKSWKNEHTRHESASGAAETPNVTSTISTKLRSSRRMKRLASAAAKLLRASGSAFSFFLYASYDARLSKAIKPQATLFVPS